MGDIFDEMKKFEREMELLLESFLHPRHPVSYHHQWNPSVNVFETEEKLVVLIEAAGVSSEDIKIMLEGNNLVIRGIRRDPFKESGKNFYVMEIDFGAFERVIMLPVEVEYAGARVETENGFLKVYLPKKVKVERIIEVE